MPAKGLARDVPMRVVIGVAGHGTAGKIGQPGFHQVVEATDWATVGVEVVTARGAEASLGSCAHRGDEGGS